MPLVEAWLWAYFRTWDFPTRCTEPVSKLLWKRIVNLFLKEHMLSWRVQYVLMITLYRNYFWAIWEDVRSYFNCFSCKCKFNLHFLLDTMHIPNTSFEKKKKKKPCGKMTFLLFPGTLIYAVFVSRNDGMKRRHRWSCGSEKVKKKREKNCCDWLRQAYFIWFHQALATERPSHCHLWLGCRWTCTQWTKLVELNCDFIPASQWQQPVSSV